MIIITSSIDMPYIKTKPSQWFLSTAFETRAAAPAAASSLSFFFYMEKTLNWLGFRGNDEDGRAFKRTQRKMRTMTPNPALFSCVSVSNVVCIRGHAFRVYFSLLCSFDMNFWLWTRERTAWILARYCVCVHTCFPVMRANWLSLFAYYFFTLISSFFNIIVICP